MAERTVVRWFNGPHPSPPGEGLLRDQVAEQWPVLDELVSAAELAGEERVLLLVGTVLMQTARRGLLVDSQDLWERIYAAVSPDSAERFLEQRTASAKRGEI
jgi:hypothetical protein